jgi:prevent-host-death family protein
MIGGAMQKSYSIYETKAKFSEILRIVKSGKKVIVSERGVPIAEIVPFESDLFNDRMSYLIKHGNIVKAKAKSGFYLYRPLEGVLDRFLAERD